MYVFFFRVSGFEGLLDGLGCLCLPLQAVLGPWMERSREYERLFFADPSGKKWLTVLSWVVRKRGHKRVGILAPNTPAFLESVYGVVAAGAVLVPVNIRLKEEDVAYILGFAEVDCVIVDREFEGLVGGFLKGATGRGVEVIVDLVSFLFFSLVAFLCVFVVSKRGRWEGVMAD